MPFFLLCLAFLYVGDLYYEMGVKRWADSKDSYSYCLDLRQGMIIITHPAPPHHHFSSLLLHFFSCALFSRLLLGVFATANSEFSLFSFLSLFCLCACPYAFLLPDKIPPALYLRLARLHLHFLQYDEAMQTYLMLCSALPTASSWLGAGIAALRLSKWKEAEECLAVCFVLEELVLSLRFFIPFISLHSFLLDFLFLFPPLSKQTS